MRKPKSILETQLDDAQQATLADWLIGGMKYHEALPVIEKEFGLKLGGGWRRQLSAFWQSVCVPHLLHRRTQAVTTSEEVAAEASRRPGQFDAATIDALKQKSFELSINPGTNPKDVKALFSLVLKARDQDLSERQLNLDREKFEFDGAQAAMREADFIKAVKADSKLSEAEKIDAIRSRLFGQLPPNPS